MRTDHPRSDRGHGGTRRARELTGQGHLLRLWTLTGRGRALRPWQAGDTAGIQIVTSLPLDAWTSVDIAPLGPHPSDPAHANC